MYDWKGVLRRINAEQPPERVLEQIIAAVTPSCGGGKCCCCGG